MQDLSNEVKKNNKPKTKPKSEIDGEYIDYEEIE